jgi:hypothetical protein
MVALSVSDIGDGTGGVAAITGAGPASTVTVYRSVWTGDTQALSWSSAGSRVGDGNVAVTGSGYYLWQAIEDTGAGLVISNAYYQNLTNSDTSSVLYRILEAFRLRIVSLNLSGISSSSIYTAWVFRSLEGVDPDPPSIVIAKVGSVGYPGKMTSTDDIVYPIGVGVVDKQNQNATKNLESRSLWWEKISRAFRSQRLPGVTEVYRVDPSSQPVLDNQLWSKNYLVMPLSWQVTSREPRGLS